MCDNDDMEDGDYTYEYADEEDEEQTDVDFDEYDYDNDDEVKSTALCREVSKDAHLEVIPDGQYLLKEYTEISPMMEALENDISALLNIDRDAAEIALQKHKWNKERLVDAFFADAEKVLLDAGVDLYDQDIIKKRLTGYIKSESEKASSSASSFVCRICGDDFQSSAGFAAGCDHWFCGNCYGEYLKSQVSDGPICIKAKCPEYKCTQTLPRSVFKQFLDEPTYFKYRMYITRNFVDNSKNMKYCPSANCTKVAIGTGVTRIHCTCAKPFCFRCGEEAHDPCTCPQVAVWNAKCQDESETANWILANTKTCPQCRTRIEKNQGCNHMSCKICKFEFCWICSASWAEHGQATGGYYKCNRFEAKIDGSKNATDKAKAELDKYLHYYKRYHAHDMSLKFASQQREGAEQKMLEQQEIHKTSWIDVQFVKQAVEQVIECRRVLKYTYAFGFFLEDERSRQLFEHHQEMLEKNTEKLQEYTEEPLEKMDRTNIVNLTRVTEKFLESMLNSVETETQALSLDSNAKASSSAEAIAPASPVRANSGSKSPRVTTRSVAAKATRR